MRIIYGKDNPRDDTVSLVGVVRVVEGRPVVCCGDGWLELLRVQPDGRRAMDGRSFVNGTAGLDGSRFGDSQQKS